MVSHKYHEVIVSPKKIIAEKSKNLLTIPSSERLKTPEYFRQKNCLASILY